MMRVIISVSIALVAVMGAAGADPAARAVSGTLVGVSPELGPTGCTTTLQVDAVQVGTAGRGTGVFDQGGPGCVTPQRAAITFDCVSIPAEGATVLEASGESEIKERFVIRIVAGQVEGQYQVSVRRFQAGTADGACGTRSQPTLMSGAVRVVLV